MPMSQQQCRDAPVAHEHRVRATRRPGLLLLHPTNAPRRLRALWGSAAWPHPSPSINSWSPKGNVPVRQRAGWEGSPLPPRPHSPAANPRRPPPTLPPAPLVPHPWQLPSGPQGPLQHRRHRPPCPGSARRRCCRRLCGEAVAAYCLLLLLGPLALPKPTTAHGRSERGGSGKHARRRRSTAQARRTVRTEPPFSRRRGEDACLRGRLPACLWARSSVPHTAYAACSLASHASKAAVTRERRGAGPHGTVPGRQGVEHSNHQGSALIYALELL